MLQVTQVVLVSDGTFNRGFFSESKYNVQTYTAKIILKSKSMSTPVWVWKLTNKKFKNAVVWDKILIECPEMYDRFNKERRPGLRLNDKPVNPKTLKPYILSKGFDPKLTPVGILADHLEEKGEMEEAETLRIIQHENSNAWHLDTHPFSFGSYNKNCWHGWEKAEI